MMKKHWLVNWIHATRSSFQFNALFLIVFSLQRCSRFKKAKSSCFIHNDLKGARKGGPNDENDKVRRAQLLTHQLVEPYCTVSERFGLNNSLNYYALLMCSVKSDCKQGGI